MKRFLGVLLLTVAATACDDPLIVLGDMPGTMQRVAGLIGRPGDELDSLAIDSRLWTPRGLAVADDATLYIADPLAGRVLRVSPDLRIREMAGASSGCTSVCPVEPTDVALDAAGDLWIADPAAQRVFRRDRSSGALIAVVGDGSQGDAPDGTPALEASLAAPTGLAIGPDGVVYFSELAGHRVRRIADDGTLETVAGTGEAGFSGDGGDARAARLGEPAGLAVGQGRLYIADRNNNRVREVDLATGTIRTVAGNGLLGFGDADSVALESSMNRPHDVALSADGRSLFVADTHNHRVRLVDIPSGRISTFAGTGSTETPQDGLDAGQTALREPAGVTVLGSQTLFLSDGGHHVVWRARFSP